MFFSGMSGMTLQLRHSADQKHDLCRRLHAASDAECALTVTPCCVSNRLYFLFFPSPEISNLTYWQEFIGSVFAGECSFAVHLRLHVQFLELCLVERLLLLFRSEAGGCLALRQWSISPNEHRLLKISIGRLCIGVHWYVRLMTACLSMYV